MRAIERRTIWGLILAALLTVTAAQANVAPPDSPKSKSTKAQAAKSKARVVAAARKVDVKSTAFFVIDEENADVLLAKKAETVMPIASITKLMTALVVLEAGQPLDEMLKITKEDRDIEVGRRSRLVVGASLTRGDLLHLALMSSENRAANALGRNYPGGLPGVLRAMNAKAKALGMKSTRFDDPTGLSEGNVASPRDLAKLVSAASRHATIRDFSTDSQYTVPVGKHLVEYRTTNSLVRKADWDVVVQKTGFTNAAGQCLVMKTIIEDRPVVMVLMNSIGKYTRVADARRVRKWLEAEERVAYRGASAQTAHAQ